MITIRDIKTLDGQITDLRIVSSFDQNLEAKGRLLLFPALIDPHISLGSPDREEWVFGIDSVVRGGITTILDIPSKDSPSENKQELNQKKLLVEKQLANLKMPLHYFPYVKGNSAHIEELGAQKHLIMGSLLLFKPNDSALDDWLWDRIFQIAAWEDLPIVINSRKENTWQHANFKLPDETLLEKAIYYAERQNTRLYVLNISTQHEIELIQKARSRSLLVYAETTPTYLFPKNPSQADFLWEALNRGIIETIGSGYDVEEQRSEKLSWQGIIFDFLNPIFLLPLLLTAYHERKITLENIVRLTKINLYDIFKLDRRDENFVLVDLEKEQLIQRIGDMQSKPNEMKLKGWPEYIILKGNVFKSEVGNYRLTRIEQGTLKSAIL